MTVTNAMRLLKQAGIEFDTSTYEVDESDLSGVHLAQVLGAQWASNNDTFVRSQRGAGLTKHSPGSSRTLFVVVLAHTTTNCQEKVCNQNTGTRGACGLFKKWFPTWSEGFFLPVCSLLMFLILILIGEKLPGIFCV